MAACCLYLLAAQLVHAGITKCTLADGSIVYQDTACKIKSKPESKKEQSAKTIPLGIEKTWFDPPGAVPHQVICTKSGCECSEYYREFEYGLAMAVADALYLDGSWHRLEGALTQLEFSSSSLTGPEYRELARERDEAACDILMSQQTLRKFGESVLAKLRNKKRYAESMGYDNPDDCDAGNLSICEHTDNIVLYNRILADIQALRKTTRTINDVLKKSDVAESGKQNF